MHHSITCRLPRVRDLLLTRSKATLWTTTCMVLVNIFRTAVFFTLSIKGNKKTIVSSMIATMHTNKKQCLKVSLITSNNAIKIPNSIWNLTTPSTSVSKYTNSNRKCLNCNSKKNASCPIGYMLTTYVDVEINMTINWFLYNFILLLLWLLYNY
jgi:hypothetical protein